MKTHAAFGPLLKFGQHIFGNQDDMRGAADEFVFGRVGLGNDESENRGTVGRRDGDEPITGLQLGVVGKVEASWSTKKRMLRSWLRTKMFTHWMLRWGVGFGHGAAADMGRLYGGQAGLPEGEKWGTI
jgi:hypothetical protein